MIVHEPRLPEDKISPQYGVLGYSMRRYFIDEFYSRRVSKLPSGSLVLDLGGTKILKRGQFNIERYDLRVVYVNLSTAKLPDVQADAAHIPSGDRCFDAVICSELLEHVPDPLAVLHQVQRVLLTGGVLLMSVPFFIRIHADPYDYGRYTNHYWLENLARIGFIDIEIEKQGLFWSVLVDMLRELAYHMAKERRPRAVWVRHITKLIDKGKQIALAWEAQPDRYEHSFFSSFTTGFGIKATKA